MASRPSASARYAWHESHWHRVGYFFARYAVAAITAYSGDDPQGSIGGGAFCRVQAGLSPAVGGGGFPYTNDRCWQVRDASPDASHRLVLSKALRNGAASPCATFAGAVAAGGIACPVAMWRSRVA